MGFKLLEPEDLVISTDSVTATVWSNNTPTLTSFQTSSIQVATNTGQYYYSVYPFYAAKIDCNKVLSSTFELGSKVFVVIGKIFL